MSDQKPHRILALHSQTEDDYEELLERISKNETFADHYNAMDDIRNNIMDVMKQVRNALQDVDTRFSNFIPMQAFEQTMEEIDDALEPFRNERLGFAPMDFDDEQDAIDTIEEQTKLLRPICCMILMYIID